MPISELDYNLHKRLGINQLLEPRFVADRIEVRVTFGEGAKRLRKLDRASKM